MSHVVLRLSLIVLGILGCGTAASVQDNGEALLPTGGAPAALQAPYFPSRMHEFIWRNWRAAPQAAIAKILGATVEQVAAIGGSMGLPPDAAPEDAMRSRGYLTLIRRNWHLLPYPQLLELLDMTPQRLSVMLREEDFLWVKLGRLKPACEALRYHEPTPEEQVRAAEIREIVSGDFGDALRQRGEPRFDFVRQLAALPAAAPQDNGGPRRIVYSYVSVYGDPLLDPSLDPYPDGFLARLAAAGINGVWLQGVLRDLAPGGAAFPEFGAHCEERLQNLRALVGRAKRFGIEIYLYINEPRAMPAAFFEKHPDVAGVHEAELTALCTSAPEVRQWLGDALAHVFREVPGLGGVYTITASENLTNCASHGDWKPCPRCSGRSEADIITEVNAVIAEGVHRGAPDARVLVSDWGWRGHGEASDMVARLPKDTWLMSVSEWNLPIERGGVQSLVGEYSISAVGPGPRSRSHWKAARAAGLKAGAEIQFNNTCELASVPYLPVLDLVAEHCANLQPFALDAYFIGWTMGGHPSPNLDVPRRFAEQLGATVDSVLDGAARARFGNAGAPLARKAWSAYSRAFREYPFHVGVVYTSPVQWGAANPLYAVKTGYSATMWGIPYDDLDGWRGPYPPRIFAEQFDKLARGWADGDVALAEAVAAAPETLRVAAAADLRYARAAGIHFQSVANQVRFVSARDALISATNDADRAVLKAEIKKVLESEIVLAKRLFALTLEDSRIGFEPSCQYFYLPLDLVEKVMDCRWLLARLAQ